MKTNGRRVLIGTLDVRHYHNALRLQQRCNTYVVSKQARGGETTNAGRQRGGGDGRKQGTATPVSEHTLTGSEQGRCAGGGESTAAGRDRQ